MTFDAADAVAAAEQWIEADPDPVTRVELQRLIDKSFFAELSDRMAGTLEFGTAGLRGVVGAGSNRMNRATVIRVTKGLADHLLSRYPGESPLVIVGQDARPSSEAFMEDAVGVLAAAGLTVEYFPEATPTPIVAYAALSRGACAAVVVTASHNPPDNNGYKIYDANGAQIIPPTDRHIAEAIAAVGPAAAVSRVTDLAGHDGVATLDSEIFARYLDDMEQTRARPAWIPPLKVAYTPLHGVGGKYVVAALAHAGYVDVHPVADQFDPDGLFPTVRLPNPEEPDALDLAYGLATKIGADLVIANDPDTDRLAVGIPHDGAWCTLTGNQIGALLGDHLLASTTAVDPIVVSSIVSSPILASIAVSHGARFAQSLTGFKWIWNAALSLEADGDTFVFGYEEALGYSVGRAVRDKDGISAAVAFADLAACCTLDGVTVRDRLEALYRTHGMWVSNQLSVVRPGPTGAAEIAAAMERIVAEPPATLDGVEVTSVVDYASGAEARPRYLPATKLVELELGDLGRLLVRPSGTEPKLKVYGDLRAETAGVRDLGALERRLLDRADGLASGLISFLELS